MARFRQRQVSKDNIIRTRTCYHLCCGRCGRAARATPSTGQLALTALTSPASRPAGPSTRATLVPASQPAAVLCLATGPFLSDALLLERGGRRPALDPGAQQCPGPLLSAAQAHSVPASHLLTLRRTLPPSTRQQVSSTRPSSPGPPLPIPAHRRSPSALAVGASAMGCPHLSIPEAQVLCRPPRAHYL